MTFSTPGHSGSPRDDSPSDAALVTALANGDRAALGELYDRYSSLLLAVGVQRLGDRRDAEEVLHDVFVEAWRSADSYDESRGTVRAWLVTRMHSRALDRRRAPAWSRRAPYDEARAERISIDDDPSLVIDRGRVQAALDALPDEQRQVVELSYYSGLSSSEIAERAAVPVGTVKSRTAAALGKLRSGLLGGRR
ncbi:MAG: sigma-70 family RNA polymerase sigma factor [Pseudomonadota bacterium]|nr:sigma-70 family RNA polymerase sigma factor [Pseudomonadota bacterium]